MGAPVKVTDAVLIHRALENHCLTHVEFPHGTLERGPVRSVSHESQTHPATRRHQQPNRVEQNALALGRHQTPHAKHFEDREIRLERTGREEFRIHSERRDGHLGPVPGRRDSHQLAARVKTDGA